MSKRKSKLSIVAEVAQGFEGNFHQSRLLIKAAAKSGANAVKFQLVYADELATSDYKYYSLFKDLEMSVDKWVKLKTYASSLNINLIFDVFGGKSLKTAELTKIETIKVHGTDVTNVELLEAISVSSINTVILGVGGAYIDEIEKAVRILQKKKLVLMCGFQGYPTKNQDNQISRIKIIRNRIKKLHSDFELGFADHADIEKFSCTYTLVALGIGATFIEKHITLGKVMELEDHESALNPDEFNFFVNQLINAEKALGLENNEKDFGMSEAEKKYRKNIRRDVVAQKDIVKGTILSFKNLTLKRTAHSNTVKKIDLVIGKTVNKNIKKNQPILKKDLK